MADNFPNSTLRRILDDNKAWRNGLTLRLYKNDYTPVIGSTSANFTECNFSGYSSQATTLWGTAYSALAGARGESDDTVHLFAHDGGGTANDVYGFYLTDGSGNYIYGERNPDAPVAMNDATDVYAVVPRLQTANG